VDEWTAAPRIGRSSDSPAGRGSPSGSLPTVCATRSSPPPSTPASRSAMSRRRPATPTPGPRCGTTGPDSPWTGMPPTWPRPLSPEPPADPRRPERYHALDPPSRAGSRAVNGSLSSALSSASVIPLRRSRIPPSPRAFPQPRRAGRRAGAVGRPFPHASQDG
jgi:hypothetical protein